MNNLFIARIRWERNRSKKWSIGRKQCYTSPVCCGRSSWLWATGSWWPALWPRWSCCSNAALSRLGGLFGVWPDPLASSASESPLFGRTRLIFGPRRPSPPCTCPRPAHTDTAHGMDSQSRLDGWERPRVWPALPSAAPYLQPSCWTAGWL